MRSFELCKSVAAATALALVLAGPLSTPAGAQPRPEELAQPAVPIPGPGELTGESNYDKRLSRDEKALRDLRQIVLQAKAQGAPVEVKDAGPDPQVIDLQTRANDFEQTLQRINGQLDMLDHDLQLARKALSDQADADKALAARLDKIEAQLQPPPPPAPPPGATSGYPTGVLGQVPANAGAPADPGADEAGAYRQARQVLDTGDFAAGAAALQDYLQQFPDSPRAPEASYWLGRTLALRNMPADAAAAYVRALKGWPQEIWAPDAVVRLAGSLTDLKRGDDACAALGEFTRHYAARAVAAVKTRAREARARAACS